MELCSMALVYLQVVLPYAPLIRRSSSWRKE